MGSRREGIRREDQGTVDAAGFIAPSVGLVDHALYFTSAPDVLAKTRKLLDEDRLDLPGAVIVWDETIGRRKGSKAVAGSWWASAGSVTMTVVFDSAALAKGPLRDLVVEAVLEAVASFSPSTPTAHLGEGRLAIGDKWVGRIDQESHAGAEIFVVRLNANTDFGKAPQAVQDSHTRLVDHIDEGTLPLGRASTLPNTLSLAIMREVPLRLLTA